MRTFQVIIFLLLATGVQAQDVEFIAEASPNVLRVGEQFNLIYTSNQKFDEFNIPEISDFQLLGGPSQGQSKSVSSINGKITTNYTYQYTYFLRAVKEGKFNIPAATIKVKNKIFHSNAVAVEVLKVSSSSSANPAATGTNTKQPAEVSENDLFVRLILDKSEAYIGEQIMATVKIYTKTNLAGIDQGFKGPDYTGFFTEPLETPPLRNLQREAVNGDIYGTGIIRRMVIIPQKSGELTIDPFELDVALRREVRRRYSDPFFDDFSIPDVQEIPLKLKSKAVKVRVKPLPPKAPSSFKGAVGNFSISSTLNKTVTAVNEPLTLKVAVTGRGNLKLINDITLEVPYDMERYDPVINTRMDNVLSGSKTFEYMIMPRVAGEFTIPPAEFSYFDAGANQYKTLKTESYKIIVQKGEGDSLIMIPGINKEDVRLLNEDIRFIKTKSPRLNYINRYIAHSLWYYLIYGAALILFLIMLSLRRKVARQHADIAGMRLRRADKYARKRLRKSENLLKQGNDAAFFEEMLGALWGYLSDKLNIPVSALSKDSAHTALQSHTSDHELISELFSIIDTCEMARYGYGTAGIDKHQLYHKAVKVITSLQQELK